MNGYVALSDPGVIWGQKYHFCLFAWKLIFGDWNHQRYIPWWQKMQKSAEKWSKMVFFAAIFKIEFSSPMTEHRFLVFSLNIAILSAAQHETLSFLREHVFLWNADNILHLSVLFLLNFSGQIPLITGVQTFCKIFGYIQAAFWQLYGWLQGLSSQIPFRCTLCPGQILRWVTKDFELLNLLGATSMQRNHANRLGKRASEANLTE